MQARLAGGAKSVVAAVFTRASWHKPLLAESGKKKRTDEASFVKGSMPPRIGHMEFWARMQKADFSEHIQRFKPHGNP